MATEAVSLCYYNCCCDSSLSVYLLLVLSSVYLCEIAGLCGDSLTFEEHPNLGAELSLDSL